MVANTACHRHLLSFEDPNAIAIPACEATGASQLIVRTENPRQPFRVSRHQARLLERVIALIA